ncbi:MAG: HIT domain-containing protein [Phycisphaerae bacterium]|nr:HIT domain-containing protein [Phycisphaerae bacterium]
MADVNKNLWAPWRMEFIRSLEKEQQACGCFLCNYWSDPDSDSDNHVVWRGKTAFVVMNRFPYTNGHLLIASAAHKGDYEQLTDDELLEMQVLTRQSLRLLRDTVHAQGFNIGVNLGHCAGAGLPDHIHIHVVPRWAGDTNYMAVLGDTRVIPDGLDSLYHNLLKNAAF